MVYWAILFYQDYRNHAKSNGKSVAFFVAKGLLSQTLYLFSDIFKQPSILYASDFVLSYQSIFIWQHNGFFTVIVSYKDFSWKKWVESVIKIKGENGC
ncbi:Uncharacterised protein [Streptococcus constellatus]|nr:Uncharacterised protein [Streptococcus constellatus]